MKRSSADWDIYHASDEVKAINQRYATAIKSGTLTDEDCDRWQLDLLYHHFDNMDEMAQKRARKTIRFLEQRIVTQAYPVSA